MLKKPENVTSRWSNGDFGKTWSGQNKPLNPTRDVQVDLILQLVNLVTPMRILDLGCGPGLIAKRILQEYPKSRYVGVDVSDACVERARKELGCFGSRVEIVHCDFGECSSEIDGKFDLVMAAQSLHHFVPTGKKRLFAAIKAMLTVDGLFIVSDRIEMAHWTSLKYFLAVENFARRELGFEAYPENYAIAEYRDRHIEHNDTPDSVEFHLSELRHVGFVADCIWQFGFRAIIVAHSVLK